MRVSCEGSWGNKKYMITTDRPNTAIYRQYKARTAHRTVCNRYTHYYMLYTKQYRHCTQKRNIQVRSRNHCCCGRAINVTYSDFVTIALVTKQAKRMRRTILSCVACLAIPGFPHSHKRHDFRKKKKNIYIYIYIYILNVNVFSYSLQLLPETFLILRRTKRHMIKTVYRSSYKAPLFMSDFNETGIFSTDF